MTEKLPPKRREREREKLLSPAHLLLLLLLLLLLAKLFPGPLTDRHASSSISPIPIPRKKRLLLLKKQISSRQGGTRRGRDRVAGPVLRGSIPGLNRNPEFCLIHKKQHIRRQCRLGPILGQPVVGPTAIPAFPGHWEHKFLRLLPLLEAGLSPRPASLSRPPPVPGMMDILACYSCCCRTTPFHFFFSIVCT